MHRILAALWLLAGTTAAAAEPWRDSAIRLLPQGYVAGTATHTDLAAMTGLLAAFPAGADDPRTPGSAFDRGHVLEVRLARQGDALLAVSGRLRPRRAEDRLRQLRGADATSSDALLDQFEEMNREIAARAEDLPPGTVPCDLHAWSTDRDPKGLNVRAEPSTKARILGTLPPPWRFKARGTENAPESGWLTEFRVIGFKEGWFLVEGAEPPGRAYEDETVYPRNHPRPYAGRGWVHGSRIGAAYANGGTRGGGLFQAPHVHARWTPAKNGFREAISVGDSPKRILACSGLWGLVESHDGVTGWWRSLCANQVTNCS